ncbi:methylated-DNA--[protein]-cysteine S-methyltransferase [Neomegalonema sp.]|uniref:methylated-DNA--[protein]-cysteine S-methyltransferase n=1 Tax=Neomegalonema sp. TaxID=2039713 RepID=UPI00345B9BCB
MSPPLVVFPTLILSRLSAPAPLDSFEIATVEGRLVRLDFGGPNASALAARFGSRPDVREEPPPAPVAEALAAWLEGDFAPAQALEVDLGGTPFQKRVWAALREIPPGETRSYLQIAERIGSPRAVRAVGAANGRNPVSLVVPCHRVIGADGSMTGYGGGLPRKIWMLEHEGALKPAPQRPEPQGALFG